MGEVVNLAELRSACSVLVDWADNPPTPDTADWKSLDRAVQTLRLHTHLRGPIGDAIVEIISTEEDPDGIRLDEALNVFRTLFRLGESDGLSPAVSR